MSLKKSDSRKALNSKIDENIYNSFSQYCEEAGQSKRIALERVLQNFLEEYFSQDEKDRRPL